MQTHPSLINLNNIAEAKLYETKLQTMRECEVCKIKEQPQEPLKLGEACEKCRMRNTALDRYAKANIPVKYWKLKVDPENFLGPKQLMTLYLEITQDLTKTYHEGKSIMFAGSLGIGKTTICTAILRKAAEKGFSAQYLTLNDIVSNFVSQGNEDKAALRNHILKVDFLVIDEFDPRHIGSQNAADLFGRILEDIVRIRFQNNMPTFFCSNSDDAKNAFQGDIKRSLNSLWNYVKEVKLIDKDLRKEGK